MKRKTVVPIAIMLLATCFQVHAQEQPRYMGGPVELVTAPNIALTI